MLAMIITVNMGNNLTATGRLIHKHITTHRCVCQEFVNAHILSLLPVSCLKTIFIV